MVSDNKAKDVIKQINDTWLRGYKFCPCSTQLNTKFQPLIKTRLLKSKEVSCCKSLRCGINHANKCYNANNCLHFNIYEQDKFCAQLS